MVTTEEGESLAIDLIIPWAEIQAGDLMLVGSELVVVEKMDLLSNQPWGDETYTRVDVTYRYPDGSRKFATDNKGERLAAVRREVPVAWDAAVTREDIKSLIGDKLLTWSEESGTMAKAISLLLGELPADDWRRLVDAIADPVWALLKRNSDTS
jgi:hypothetical protein